MMIQVYDPPMCCPTGVCGPTVDPVLVRFSADAQWLGEQGVEVRRFNLSQNPAAFVENELVRSALTEKGEAALPLLLLNGQVIASGKYPERAELAGALGLNSGATSLFTPAVRELVAIGAAIAANCEPCLRYHVNAAQKLGVTIEDITRTVEWAAKVKDAPHQAVLRLAARLTQTEVTDPVACCGRESEPGDGGKGGCC
ncbi:MAG: arsenite efflux transporter metallochaperone ArsD [Opitutus sp.]